MSCQVLPATVKPIRYTLLLQPEFESLENDPLDRWGYIGTVIIKVDIQRPTNTICLNAVDIRLLEFQVASESPSFALETKNFRYDVAEERVAVVLNQEVPKSIAAITIKFQGMISASPTGFYRTGYNIDNASSKLSSVNQKRSYMAHTDFVPCGARRAFPCFDQPSMKAEVALTIVIENNMTALSNMPVRQEIMLGKNRKSVEFETSPPISTYQISWAVGKFFCTQQEFGSMEEGSRVSLKVYSIRDLKRRDDVNLQSASRTLAFISRTLKVDFPMPKLDFLSTPSEGFIEYRPGLGLSTVDEKDVHGNHQIDTPGVMITLTISICYQWFGSLIHISWWNDWWRIAAFVTWVSFYTVNDLLPDEKVWSRVTRALHARKVFQMDALSSSKPLAAPVQHPSEIAERMDFIATKGCSVLGMLARWVGEKVFLHGLTQYLQLQREKPDEFDCLYCAFGEAPSKDVKLFTDAWICRPGYPVLTVEKQNGQYTMTQSRFLFNRLAEEEEELWWPIPLENRSNQSNGPKTSFVEREVHFTDDSFPPIFPGYYYVRYSDKATRNEKLRKEISQNNIEGIATLIDPISDFAMAGLCTIDDLLDTLQFVASESGSTRVREVIFRAIISIKILHEQDRRLCEDLDRLISKLNRTANPIRFNRIEGHGS